MAHPVVHFEIMSPEAPKLRQFFSDAFGWTFAPALPMGDGAGDYATVEPAPGTGISGGIGTATNGYPGHVTFYVYTDDVEGSLRKVESLGGTRVMGPVSMETPPIELALFKDPDGNTIGLVKPGEM
ncbi:MAG TPA: VOC family protein [Candidatus Aquilonibacter sp.]|nr:VOC family protein [Candidatus Aquilonibacter sp.]